MSSAPSTFATKNVPTNFFQPKYFSSKKRFFQKKIVRRKNFLLQNFFLEKKSLRHRRLLRQMTVQPSDVHSPPAPANTPLE